MFLDYYRVRHQTFFQLVLISWMVTLISCLIWQIISFILPLNEYGCVSNAFSLSGPAIDLQKMPILPKKSSFQMKLILILVGKADTPKTSHCLVRILVQRHNWAIFLRKWARSGCYSQWRSLSNHVERGFVRIEEKDIGNIWFQQDDAMCHTAKATLDVLRPVFKDRIISRRTVRLDYYLWSALKDKCYHRKLTP